MTKPGPNQKQTLNDLKATLISISNELIVLKVLMLYILATHKYVRLDH